MQFQKGEVHNPRGRRQYHGGPDSPDLAGDLPGLHVEVKRCERLSLFKALTQARQDASVTQVPTVMHRANSKPWVIVVQVEDLIRLLDVVDAWRAKLGDAPAAPAEEGSRDGMPSV